MLSLFLTLFSKLCRYVKVATFICLIFLGNELDLFDGNYANESEAALIGDLLNYIVMKGIPGTNVLVCTATISQIKYIKSSIEKIR